VAEVRRLDFVNRSPRQLVADPRVKPAPHEKECRARRLSSSSSAAARLLRLSITKASREVENKRHRKKPRRPGHNNSAGIFGAAPERTIPEPLFL